MAIINCIKDKILKLFGIDLEYYSRIENFTMDVLDELSKVSHDNPNNALIKEYLQLTIDYIRSGKVLDKQKYKYLIDYVDRPDLVTKILLRKITFTQVKL